jgi:hypothetical protein
MVTQGGNWHNLFDFSLEASNCIFICSHSGGKYTMVIQKNLRLHQKLIETEDLMKT